MVYRLKFPGCSASANKWDWIKEAILRDMIEEKKNNNNKERGQSSFKNACGSSILQLDSTQNLFFSLKVSQTIGETTENKVVEKA